MSANHVRPNSAMTSSSALLLFEAIPLLCLTRVLVIALPFRVFSKYLGVLYKSNHDADSLLTRFEKESGAGTYQAALTPECIATQVSRIVRGVTRRLPFLSNCLTASLVASYMLHRRGLTPRLHLGFLISPSSQGKIPHAWLDWQEIEVVGYPEANFCAKIGYYSREH